MVKKVIATFSDKMALRVLGLLAGTGLAFCVAALLLPSMFTAGAGDWSDPVYLTDARLLLNDQMKASFVLGVCCTLFVVAEGLLIWRYAAVVRHRKHRLAITVASVAFTAWFALTLAGIEVASYASM